MLIQTLLTPYSAYVLFHSMLVFSPVFVWQIITFFCYIWVFFPSVSSQNHTPNRCDSLREIKRNLEPEVLNLSIWLRVAISLIQRYNFPTNNIDLIHEFIWPLDSLVEHICLLSSFCGSEFNFLIQVFVYVFWSHKFPHLCPFLSHTYFLSELWLCWLEYYL